MAGRCSNTFGTKVNGHLRLDSRFDARWGHRWEATGRENATGAVRLVTEASVRPATARVCFTPLDLGMWAIFCDSLIGNQHTRDRHSNDALLCIHADSATALMDSHHLALALLAKLA